jgi:hypothetical protein
MRKSSLKIVNLTFVVALILGACSGKEMPKEEMAQSVTASEESTLDFDDTVWVVDELIEGTIPPFKLDAEFTKSGKKLRLTLNTRPLERSLSSVDITLKNDTLYGYRRVGPNAEVSIVIKDSLDKTILSSVFTKKELLSKENAGHLIAESAFAFEFEGFYPEFNAVLLKLYLGYPDSDDVIEEFIFIGLDGTIKMSFTNSLLFNGCDCELTTSPDGRTLSLCKGLLHSNYRLVSLQKEGVDLTGIFQIGNKTSVVIYTYEGKPPYYNGVLVDRSGRTVKTFSFEGISGAVRYQIPHFRIEETNALVLIDAIEGRLIIFDSENEGDFQIKGMDELPGASQLDKMAGKQYTVVALENSFQFYYFNGALSLKR